VEACTVTALDATTAFAIPNPGSSSQKSAGFFGSGYSSGCPVERITQPTSGWQVLFRQSFQPSTWNKLNSCFNRVNAIVGGKTKYLCRNCGKSGTFVCSRRFATWSHPPDVRSWNARRLVLLLANHLSTRQEISHSDT
jgi:hypothetical protein